MLLRYVWSTVSWAGVSLAAAPAQVELACISSPVYRATWIQYYISASLSNLNMKLQ